MMLSLIKTSPEVSVFKESSSFQATKSEIDICPDAIWNKVLSQPYTSVLFYPVFRLLSGKKSVQSISYLIVYVTKGLSV